MELNNVIQERIGIIETCLQRLEEVRKDAKKQFLEDWRLQDIALRNFQVAIEAVIDIANHIISERKLRIPKSSIESMEILGENKILPKDFVGTIKNMVKFRNVIVHWYGEVELENVYDNLSKIDDFKKFIGYILRS